MKVINVDGNKALSIKEYLDAIKPYLEDLINNLKKYMENSINSSN